jgi:hypothetical protein
MPISLDQYRVSNAQFYTVAIRARHILSLFEYQLIHILIFGGVKFLPCLIILHFLCNDLVTTFMMHNHHGTKVNYTRNISSTMHYMFSVITILLIISGIELNPGPIDNRTFSDSSTSTASHIHKETKNNVSFLQLNVQSLKPKLDLISAEYGDFDILSFTKT